MSLAGRSESRRIGYASGQAAGPEKLDWADGFASEYEYTARSSFQRWGESYRGTMSDGSMKDTVRAALIAKRESGEECPGLQAIPEDEWQRFGGGVVGAPLRSDSPALSRGPGFGPATLGCRRKQILGPGCPAGSGKKMGAGFGKEQRGGLREG